MGPEGTVVAIVDGCDESSESSGLKVPLPKVRSLVGGPQTLLPWLE